MSSEWLKFPPEFRATLEEKASGVKGIIIGNADKKSPNFQKWICTLSKDNGNFYTGIIFFWENAPHDLDVKPEKKYPIAAPIFDPNTFGKYWKYVKGCFDSNNKLINWDGRKSIKDNLKQLYDLL